MQNKVVGNTGEIGTGALRGASRKRYLRGPRLEPAQGAAAEPGNRLEAPGGPRPLVARMSKSICRIFLLFSLVPALGGCKTPYRIEETAEGVDLLLGWTPIVRDALIVAALLAVFFAYRKILGRFTEEAVPRVSVGRIVTLLLAAFVGGNFLWPNAAWRIRVANEGVSERRATSTVLIPWTQMVRVRNHYEREIATPRGLLLSPRLEVIGSYEETIYIEKLEVGPEIYERMVKEIGPRYFAQDALLKDAPDPERREEVLAERKERRRELMERAQDILMTHKPETVPMPPPENPGQ